MSTSSRSFLCLFYIDWRLDDCELMFLKPGYHKKHHYRLQFDTSLSDLDRCLSSQITRRNLCNHFGVQCHEAALAIVD